MSDKTGGVRNGGTDWHDLVTLKALDRGAQVLLAASLAKFCKQHRETTASYKKRVGERWRGATIKMLSEADAHWRSEAELEATSLPASGTLVHRFTRWAESFYGRLQGTCVDEAIAAAKLAEGPGAPNPEGDGLSDSVDTYALQYATFVHYLWGYLYLDQALCTRLHHKKKFEFFRKTITRTTPN